MLLLLLLLLPGWRGPTKQHSTTLSPSAPPPPPAWPWCASAPPGRPTAPSQLARLSNLRHPGAAITNISKPCWHIPSVAPLQTLTGATAQPSSALRVAL